MREIYDAERAAVSGGLSPSGIMSWINGLIRPTKPIEPWINRFPAPEVSPGIVTGIGIFAVVAGAAILAAASGTLGILATTATGALGALTRALR
ncbi:hypothetical protein WK11_16540 [Burkholderia ubonensis]|uniref:hypothetical protein n=1 Tax=Burkholderia ubonensis TaxID=101571 RepID=UPI0007563DB2|nr:hypothetical protein [Burkholderia ubonensis]KVR03628.1 hypothetical protein WK11_16540 [Burkholderia ubonensis]